MNSVRQPNAYSILLVSNNSATERRVRAALSVTRQTLFSVECLHTLAETLNLSITNGVSVVLLDLSLPDSQGIKTFEKLFAIVPEVPIVILAEDDGEDLAIEAVTRGAQDYLLPCHLEKYTLTRALRNAIERKIVEDALFVERDRAIVTLNSIGDAVLCTDISGCVTYLNRVAESLTGWGCKDATGRVMSDVYRIVDGATRESVRDPIEMVADQNRMVGLTMNCILIRRDGVEFSIEDSAAPIHDRAGKVIGAVIVFHDVSAARAMSMQMSHSAEHDIVTDLPNRQLLKDRISQAIGLAHREHRSSAVMFLDLDHFKCINDSLGHAAGDELLRSVAQRLVASVRSSDTVSRQGGDEFVILLPAIIHADDAAVSAEKLRHSLAEPHFISGQSLQINASIGISVYPQDGVDAETLIQNADTAMYHSKNSGRNRFHFFEAQMNLTAVNRQALQVSLRRALAQREFILHYQPRIDLHTEKIVAVEALIRWQRPGRGLVPPSEFISIAEDCGLIVQIDAWVVREACRQARAWQEAGLPTLRVAVNVSTVEFRHKAFVNGIQAALTETGLTAEFLELELTENALMLEGASTYAVLHDLKTMGIHLAVDDFVTGYSSLSCLRRFPIDILKIDRSFVKEISAGTEGPTIVSAIIAIGKSLKHCVVAEGIETEDQKKYLQVHHCEQGQGYLFSPPVTAGRFALLLERGMTPRLSLGSEPDVSLA